MNQIEDVLGERMRCATSGVHLSGDVFAGAVRRHRRHQIGARVAAGGAMIAAAAAVAVAVAAVPGAGTPPARTGNVSAATALDLAAAQTITAGDPTVGAGQFTRVSTESWVGQRVDNISFLQKGRLEVWVPAGGKGTWFWKETGRLGTKFTTPADEQYLKAHHPDEFTPTVFVASGHDGRQAKTPAGQPQPLAPRDGGSSPAPDWGFPTPAWLATRPRDPDALLAAIAATHPVPAPGTTAKGDTPTLTFNTIAHALSSGIVPADLRAALYRALIKLPGVKLVSSTANLDGRKGIAVGRLEPFGFLRQEILFDAAAGAYIGEREVVVRSDDSNAHLPIGATYSSTAVKVDVTGNPHLNLT